MSRKEQAKTAAIEQIIHFLQGMDYGKVEIKIHDSQITQIEKGEKYRLAAKKIGKPLQ